MTEVQHARRTAASATSRARLERAWRQLRSPWVLLQAGAIAVAAALGAVWLEIPDRNAAQTTVSLSLAATGLIVFLLAESYILTLVRRRGGERVALWKGALLLACLWLVYTAVATIFDVGEMRDVRRAAWWSLQPRVSAAVSVDALMLLQASLWWSLRFLVMAALLPFAMEGAATGLRGRWIRRAAWLWLEPLFWGGVMGCAATGMLVTGTLLHFRPQVPLLVEILLTVFKVVAMFAADVGGLCFALALTGTFLRDAQLVMPAGVPSTVQKRWQ